MAKDTRDYNAVRVLGLTEDSDLVDVRVSSSPATSALLDLLSPCVTASDELKVKVSGDITIESVEVDRVQLVDANGNKPIYTASGAIQTAVFDGDNEALGSTSDTDSDTTVIGRLQKLIADLSALSATKTLADLETAIEGVTDSIVSMQYGGLPVSEMRTDVISTSSTPAEAKGGATAWSGQRIVHILNQGSVNIEVLTDDEATYGQIVFPGDVYQDVVDGVIYVMSASAGSARVTEKRYVSS
jgi:hypothetical protein